MMIWNYTSHFLNNLCIKSTFFHKRYKKIKKYRYFAICSLQLKK
jgi:hypothetical protein